MEDKLHGIRFRTIIEMIGKPKEHIEKTIRDYVETIRDDHEYILLNERFAETVEHESLWSTFAELEIVCKDMSKLVMFCFEYMPASVEIIKPDSFSIEKHVITGFINDLQARLHNVDMAVKKLRGENDILKKNMSLSIENQISVLLKLNSMDIDDLSTYTGINTEELNSFLNKMITAGKVKQESEIYSLSKNE